MREVFEEIRKIDRLQKIKQQIKLSFSLDDLHNFMKVWPLNHFNDVYDKDLTKSQAQSIVKDQMKECLEEIQQNKGTASDNEQLLHLFNNAVDTASNRLIQKGTFDNSESTVYLDPPTATRKIEFSDN